jgi:poly(hydroxyalkanoate) granule-associated protein
MNSNPFNFDPSQLSDKMKESAQQIWLAGLGAFAKNQEEGKKVFEKLVDDGLSLQKKTQEALHEKVNMASEKITEMASTLKPDPTVHWAPLEDLFHNRVAKANEKLGVPDSEAFQALSLRVQALEKALDKALGLVQKNQSTPSQSSAASKPTAAKKATPKSTQTKRA